MSKQPKLYYGYIVVVASAFIMLTGWGTFYSYGVFFEPLLNEFGWTRALTSGVLAVSTLVSGFVSIISGRISDRLGPRTVSTFCGTLFGLGLMLMSTANSVWQVYVYYSLPIAIGVGGLWSPMVSTIARWFVRKRGLMTGIVGSGIGVGTFVLAPLASSLISAHGWRMSYIIVGAVCLVVAVVSAQFLRRDPAEIGLAVDGGTTKQNLVSRGRDYSFHEIFRTRQFWMLAALYFLFGFSQVTVIVHVVPYATGLGISPITAASVLGMIGGASIFGRIIMGSISDKSRAKPSLIFVLILLVVSMVWLEFAGQLWALYLFSVIFGFAWGGLSALQSLAGAELFGLRARSCSVCGRLVFW